MIFIMLINNCNLYWVLKLRERFNRWRISTYPPTVITENVLFSLMHSNNLQKYKQMLYSDYIILLFIVGQTSLRLLKYLERMN